MSHRLWIVVDALDVINEHSPDITCEIMRQELITLRQYFVNIASLSIEFEPITPPSHYIVRHGCGYDVSRPVSTALSCDMGGGGVCRCGLRSPNNTYLAVISAFFFLIKFCPEVKFGIKKNSTISVPLVKKYFTIGQKQSKFLIYSIFKLRGTMTELHDRASLTKIEKLK